MPADSGSAALGVVRKYLNSKLYEYLSKDGEFSAQNRATMRAATHNIVEKLKVGELVVALGSRAGVDVSVDQELAMAK